MQNSFTTPIRPVNSRLSLKASFLKIKKMLLPAIVLIALACFAAPAAGQVTITAQGGTTLTEPTYVYYTVTFSTAQTGLSTSNFSLTGTATGFSISYVSGSGTSYTVLVYYPGGPKPTTGTLILNMVNSTGLSPGVTGLPVSSPAIQVNFPADVGAITFSSSNANPGYAKTGDQINFLVTGNYDMTYVGVTAGGNSVSLPANVTESQAGTLTLNSSTPQGGLSYDWDYQDLFLSFATGSGTANIIFDSQPPTATISAPTVGVANGNGTGSVSYTVTYADANFNTSNLTTSGITLNTTGTATGTIGLSGSGTSYTVTISNISGNGTLGISVGAGYASDKAGNTDAGAGPSSTVTVVPNVSPAISYAGPQAYAVNTAISPLAPTIIPGTEAFAGGGSKGVAFDYNGNAYAISSSYTILDYPSGSGQAVTAYNANGVVTNVAVAPVSSTTSTLIFGISGNTSTTLQSMDVVGGVFQAPVTIGPIFSGFSPVAATHPASGPDVIAVFTDNNSNINFTARTGGVYSTPAVITNATTNNFLAVNNYQGAVELAFVGPDNNLYYSIYTGGVWSAVAPWASPNISMSGIGAFALDAQGNVWYSSGASLYEIAPGSTGGIAITTLPAAANGIAFDVSGNIYVNCGSEIEELQVPTNFLVTPALPAGLSINSTTGVISGTPTSLTAANTYTVTATAGNTNLTATVNIATITTPALSYGSAVNATVGTTITPITPTSTSILPQRYNSTPTTFASVTAPTGVAVDAAGNVYVADNTNNIDKFATGVVQPTSLGLGYSPLAIDGTGNFYFTNLATSTLTGLYQFSVITPGSTTAAYGSPPTAPLSGSTCTGIAVDAAGNAYVSDNNANESVIEYTDGSPVNAQGNPFAIGNGFSSASGVATDAAGNVYVSDAGAGTIDLIPASRAQWTTIATGLGAPANICIDGAGNLYYSDNNANTISELPAGSTTPVLIASGLGTIKALAIDGKGNLYAADYTNNVIDRFNPTGGYYINPVLPPGMSFNGSTGVINGTPAAPTTAGTAVNYTVTAYNTLSSASAVQSLAVTSALPVVSYDNARTFIAGNAIATLTPASTGVAAQGYNLAPGFIDFQFGAPYAVAVDTALNVFVADPYNYEQMAVSGEGVPPNDTPPYREECFGKGKGQYIALDGTEGGDDGMFCVATDSTGNIFFTSGSLPVHELSPFPAMVESVLSNGANKGLCVSTDSHGNLFGTNGTGSVVQLFNGTTIASGFINPTGIAIDGPGNIFVGDRGNNTLYKIPAGGGTQIAVATGFNAPYQLAADGAGNIFIGDGGNGVVKELPAGGGPVITVIPNLKTPNGVAVDVKGALYVADAGFGQVRKYTPSGGYYISPSLPAGLSFNNSTGAISGTPTAVTPVKDYKITAYNASGSTQTTLRFGVLAASTSLPTLSYSSAQNYVPGTAITPVTPVSTGVYPQTYNSAPTTFASVTAPTGLAVDGPGNVYIAENGGSVVKIPAGGGLQTPIASANTSAPLATDGSGNLYVTTAEGAANGFAIFQAGASSAGYQNIGQSSYITTGTGMSVDAAGNVYTVGGPIRSYYTPGIHTTVYEYIDPLNTQPTSYGQGNALAIGTGFTAVSGLAVDAAGDVYVADGGAGTIDIIPANRGPWTTLASGLGAPANICIDGGGNLYFSDKVTNTIREIPAGSSTPVVIASGLGSITGLAVDAAGKLYAADNTNNVIDVFSPIGGYYISPVLPAGLSFSGSTGIISGTPTVASAAANYTITAYNTVGSVSATQSISVTTTLPTLTYAGATGFTTGLAKVITPASTGVAAQGYATAPVFMDNQFGAPLAVAVDTLLHVYVADPWNFDGNNFANGDQNQLVFTEGNVAPLFYTPQNYQLTSVAVDSAGNVYINKYPSGLSRLVPTGNTYVETKLLFGSEIQVAVDSKGNVSAASGTSVLQSPGGGTGAITTIASGFSMLSGIAVDGPGNIFVADSAANALYKIPAGSSTPAVVATGFNSPDALAVDGTGNVFIADVNNGVIKELPAGGGPVTTVLSGFKAAKGVAVDVNGVLYVADESFAQVRKYAPSGGYYISPSLPPGLSFNNSTGVISGTPTTVTPVKDYKITAYNASGSVQTKVRFGVAPPSSSLAGLAVSAGSLSPSFASASLSYSVSASYSSTQTTVTPTPTDPNATIRVNGSAVTNGSASAPISLAIGTNTITIVVTASDHSSMQTYTLTVTRAAASSNALLSSAGIGYVVSGNTVEAVVTPTTADPTATVTVNGVTVASGSASNPIPLNPGANNIAIVVTAQNGLNKMTYTITVDGPLGSTSSLSALTISAGMLSPAFSPGTTSYTDNVVNSVASVTVTPTTTDPNATVTVEGATVTSGTASGAIALPVGNTVIPTVVTAQDGVTTTTYTITVTRPPSSVATLAGLAISAGTLAPGFATGTTGYATTVLNTVTGMTVTPTTTASTATVTVNGQTVTSGAASQNITLSLGANTITIVVTAQDGVTTDTYTITVSQLPPPPSLSYTSPQTYTQNTGITPLTPVSSNIAAVSYSSSPVILGSGFSAPTGVAVDASGNVYVADYSHKLVKEIPVGNGTPVTIGSGFNDPFGVAVDAAGDVYVADYGASAVYKIPAGNGTPVTIGSGFSHPTAVAIDAAGDVFVADHGNNAIKKIPAGSNTPAAVGSGFSGPIGVAVDAAGDVYVGDRGNNAVKEIPAGSNTPVTIGSGFSTPYGVAVDASGNVFVDDYGNNAVKEIPAGSTTPVVLGSGFKIPEGVAADGAGNVYVADYGNNAIKQIKPLGGCYIAPFLPAGLSFNNTTGTISGTPTAVRTAANYTITAYNIGGSGTATVNIAVMAPLPLISYSSPQFYAQNAAIMPLSPTSSNVASLAYNSTPAILGSGFSGPTGVATDAAGDVFIADYGNKLVKKIAAGTTTPAAIGSGFTNPFGVAVDAAGDVYVADYGASAVYKIASGSNTPVTIGSGFSHPTGVAIDAAGNLYVVDHSHNAVKKIAAGSNTPVAIGSGFTGPIGVAVDAFGDVYIGDDGNNAVKEIPVGSTTPVVLGSGFSKPYGIAVDASGNLFVDDYGNNAVKEIPAGTTSPVVIGSGFKDPEGVAADGAGNVYVADQGNNAIKQIKPVGGYFINATLPAGLNFANATGRISGTPTVAGPAANYTVTAYSGNGSNTATVNITVVAPPTISYTSPQTYTTTVAITPLAPTSGNVAAPAYNGALVVLGSGFSGPTGLASDAAGDVFIADYGNKLVKKIAAGTTTPVAVGSGFTNPFGVAVDAAGDVYVADYGASAVYKIPAGNGTPVTIGSGFSHPTGVAVDASGNLYIADHGHSLLKKIAAGSTTPVTIGSGFSSLIGVAVDAQGNLYVGDDGNNAVKEIPAGSTTPVVIGSGFSKPYGVAVDASGNVFVADYGNTAVKEIPAGSTIPITLASGFKTPEGVATDGAGNVYMADQGNNVVKQIKPLGGYYIGPFLPAGLTFNNTTGVVSGTPTVSSPATNYTVTAYNYIGVGRTATANITVLSSNANLSNLVLSSGPLSPVFATATTSYTANVASAVASVTLTPTTSDPTATVTVNGTTVTSGTASGGLALAVGSNSIPVVVTAQNGATQTYTVTVTRASGGADSYDPGISVTQPTESPTLDDDVVVVHQGVSPNGDGINDFLIIDGIQAYPNNKLMIMNRNGQLVYEANGYNNSSKIFDGHSNKNGQMQLPGTYFYQLEYAVKGIIRYKTGFIVLKY